MEKHKIILRKKANMLTKLFSNTLPIKMNILPEFLSFKRLSKFLEQEGYSWVNLEKFEALAWNSAGKCAHLLCGLCVASETGFQSVS